MISWWHDHTTGWWGGQRRGAPIIVPRGRAMMRRILAILIAVSVACTAGAGYFIIDVMFETAVAADSNLLLANAVSDLFSQWKSQSAASLESLHLTEAPVPGSDETDALAKTSVVPDSGNMAIAGQIALMRGLAVRGEQMGRTPRTRDEFAALRFGLDLLATRYAAHRSLTRQVGEMPSNGRSGGRSDASIHLSRLHVSTVKLDGQFEALRQNVSTLLTGSTQRLRLQQQIAVPAAAVSVVAATLASILAFLVVSGAPGRRLFASGGMFRTREIRASDSLDSKENNKAVPEVDAAVPVVANIFLDGLIVYDVRGVIEFANSAAETIFRLNPDGQVGRNLGNLIPELRRRLATPLASGETWPHADRIADCSGQMMGRRADGSNVPIQAAVGAIVFGGERKFVCCVRDLSQQVESQRATESLQEQIIQAQKRSTLSALAGGIAHDFNNVLMPIIGLTELTRAKLSRGSKEFANLTKALTAANHARDLVRQIFVFERQAQPEKRHVRLDKVVLDAIVFLRAVLPTTVELKEHIAANTNPVLADPTQIHQVLVNLGLNACAAMAESGGVLEIGLAQIEIEGELHTTQGDLMPGQHLCISVSDTGRGIDPEKIDHVFEPFFTTKTVVHGAGLGLSVVASIVRGHGGAITVRSRPGQATVFEIFLPVLRPQSEQQESSMWLES